MNWFRPLSIPEIILRSLRCLAAVWLAAQLIAPACVLASYGELQILHNFPSNSYPECTLVFGDDGALYGTTQQGGAFGRGSIFRITTGGTFTNLFSFRGSDGTYPITGLVKAGANFYGTAFQGSNGFGTVFRFNTDGVLTPLFAFSKTDGASPQSILTPGKDGALYGTTYLGGTSNLGTVFRITTNGQLTTLASFVGTNGAHPVGGLTQAQDGSFYGSTREGGPSNNPVGYGTLYRVTTNGQLTTLYEVPGFGDEFVVGELTQMEDGCLYGATFTSLFRLSTNGVFTRIGYNPLAPIYPRSGLMRGLDGALYGMAHNAAYRVTTNGVIYQLYPFYNFWNGSDPRGGLVQSPGTTFFGTMSQGGSDTGGVVFRIDLRTFFYPPVEASEGWKLFFSGLPGNAYRIERATNFNGPWTPAAEEVPTDDYGLGLWIDTVRQDKAYYRLIDP